MTAASTSPRAPRPTAGERAYHLLAPLVFALMYGGARLRGVSPSGLRQRRGFLPEVARPCLWLHGASAGEMASAANLTGLLRRHGYAFTAAYTTTNAAGLALIEGRLAPEDRAALVPWDARRWVRRGFDGWRPAALILIETELWPALIGVAAERGVPALSVSARVYPRDLPRYRLARGVMGATLSRLSTVLAQSDVERDRLVAIGAPRERCLVAGSLKHLVAPADGAQFRRSVGMAPDEPVCVIGSLHADEAGLVAAALAALPTPRPRIVVAPRHPAALAAFETEAHRRGWRVARRSVRPAAWDVLLLDTIGELRAAYAGATLALVGGSLGPHGGHDLVEPLRAGTPVLFGPHTAHAEPVASAVRTATPESLVHTADDLAARIVAWLANATARGQVLTRQRAVLPDAAAVAARYLEALAPWLEPLRHPSGAHHFSSPGIVAG